MAFVRCEDAVGWLRDRVGIRTSQAAVDALAALHLLPQFSANEGQDVFLANDLGRVGQALVTLSLANSVEYWSPTLFERGLPKALRFSDSTTLELPPKREQCTVSFPAAARHLIEFVSARTGNAASELVRLPYAGESFVSTTDSAVAAFVTRQIADITRSSAVRSSQFASSAFYMGSKRLLSGFLVAGVRDHVSSGAAILDVMCGSGAAAAGFARNWDTLASDAQQFSQILAVVQGGGYSALQADHALALILPRAREHSLKLRQRVEEFVRWEDRVFHGDTGGGALDEYRALIDAFPTYPDGDPNSDWNPSAEVARRRVELGLEPLCLFTAYFANVFFGIRQCIEIDSLRFAISTLDSSEDRTWALGALLAAVSSLGTTYGGHFAQPFIRKADDVTPANIGRIVELRASSIFHEFSIRLESLAKESEHCSRRIQTVPGPWQNALDRIAALPQKREVLIYLDAPYKREEYSRYYHVLETLVQYNYPSSIGVGRVPDKSPGERFSSEFFSRTQAKIEDTFVQIIAAVVKKGWKCAWSYSDNGNADVVRVCERVTQEHKCTVVSYATPYEHNAIGGPFAKTVVEYLFVFEPMQQA
jgi:adenine-specific DNA-methyltransferase